MNRRPLLIAISTVAVAAVVAACGGGDAASEDRLPVVASTTVVADIVENVGGQDVEVTTLVGRESDAHTFEPEPSDLEAISQAALVFEVGRGFEEWLDAAVDAAGGDADVVTLSQGIEPLAFEEDAKAHSDEEGDPHVWMTAANGIAITESVAVALAEADPDNADVYAERADAYSAQLEAAQDEVAATLDAIPPEDRILFTNHDAFGYFAEEHGFEVLGSALNSLTTEGADPSAADVASIVEEIQASGVPAIFPENTASPELLDTIARETSVAVGSELATGALGEAGSDADTYLGLLQSNAEAIAAGLTGKEAQSSGSSG